MSIVGVDLVDEPGGRTGEQNEKYDRTYKILFVVLCSDINDDPHYVLSNFAYGGSSLPIGQQYPSDTKAYCISRSAEYQSRCQVGTGVGCLYKFTATYGPWNPLENLENPLDKPVLPIIEGQTFEHPIFVDKDGNPIVNSAGDPYDPPLTEEVVHLVIRFSKNYATLPAFFGYSNYINNATWQTFAAYMVKFNIPRAEELPSQYLASTYWKFDFEFEVNPETWLRKVPNVGFNQLVSGTLKPILIGGQPPTIPQFLNSSGAVLTPPVTHTNLIINTFHTRQETDFNTVFASFPTDLFAVYASP
jgi:hypothetical protein